jgi:isopentenyl diphosphate isomerase/L-lactate dehydrogenase-like FMN-dependent dehydrogenase
MEHKLTLPEVRANAKKKLRGVCGVFKVCNGDPTRICQNNHYGGSLGFGGVGSGQSFHNNSLALAKLNLKMKLIQNPFEPDLSFSFFGKTLSMPIMGGSVAGVNSFGGESVISENYFCQAVVEGCHAAGTIGWRGDTYTYSPSECYGLDAINSLGGWGIKIIKPRAQSVIKEFISKAENINAVAVGIDIDGCGSFMMRKHQKPVSHKSLEDLQDIINGTTLPVIIKGIMTVEDAQKAVQAGASAIVVSNHGGRVLDCTPGTAEVLPEICSAIQETIPIFVDGGIRSGFDVLKMLALGADAVLIGRDIVRAAVGGGVEGVWLHMDYMRKTLRKAMIMTNCHSLVEINSSILHKNE